MKRRHIEVGKYLLKKISSLAYRKLKGKLLLGIGNSAAPMAIVIFCCCLTRIVWVSAVFPYLPHEIESLIACYPISWSLSVIAALFVLIYSLRRLKATLAAYKGEGESGSGGKTVEEK